MHQPNIKVTPKLSFQVDMDDISLSAIQRGLSWAREHGTFTPEDPIHLISAEFTALVNSLIDKQSLLASMGTEVKLTLPETVKTEKGKTDGK